MRSSRALVVVGFLGLMLAGSTLLLGSANKPWLTLAGLALGSIALIAALIGRRSEADRPTTHDPARGERLIRVVTYGLAGLGLVAVLVAILVAEGEARGHAFFHFLSGLLCVGLFAALAFLLHPDAGTGAASIRGLVLTLLAAGALGSFMESLGGSGYDAANVGHRIEALTTLHNIAVPLGGLTLIAIPLGVITGVVLLIARATRGSNLNTH